MSPEAAIASHACAHIGAVQVPVFSGFAAPAVAQRLVDSEAKVAITARSSLRRGREVPMLEILEEARREAPALEHVIVAPWDDEVAGCPGTLEPLPVDSEHPYLLTYTSGTTGKPKGVLHVQGGFLVSIAREACYQADAHPDDVVHFSTDMGWIMGPWTVVGCGAHGRDDRLRRGRAGLAVRPALAAGRGGARDDPRLLADAGPRADPARRAAGRPLVAADVRHDGRAVEPGALPLAVRAGGRRPRPDRQLSGGTEVGAVFLSCCIAEPIKACSVGGPALGMAMDVVDADGRSLVGTGEVGELVCRKPFPGMTRGFWRDPERYLETYWRRFPGIWTHGDWASVDADGYWFLHGRSDDTLNIAGKRIGPAELESAAVAHPAVTEAAAVGVPHEVKGEVAWVFCVLAPGASASEEEVRRAGRRRARARRSRPSGSSSCPRCRRRARRRSSAGPCGRPRSATIPATCPRSRTPTRSRRSPRRSADMVFD